MVEFHSIESSLFHLIKKYLGTIFHLIESPLFQLSFFLSFFFDQVIQSSYWPTLWPVDRIRKKTLDLGNDSIK
jgi:hypothetical protein